MRKTAATCVLFAIPAWGQTFTDCNPLEKSCPAEPALGNIRIDHDFSQGQCIDFNSLAGTSITYDKNGALFGIENDKHAPTIAGTKYIFFGRLEVELMASPGQGVVTSVVLQSANLDEIDWEWLGGDNTQVQTNYFGKGDTTTYDRGAFHAVAAPVSSFHKYVIDWTPKKIDWLIDGTIVRTLKYEDAQGGSRYPQTPMEVKLGTWVAGLPGNAEGTIQWAGGLANFKEAPFNAWYKSISVIDYAGGDAPCETAVKEYVYGDKSGSWQSIKVVRDGSPSVKASRNNAAL
ncbi:putative glycosidase crf1 [Paramyrothecium foliicola]|nr:putative glycosidase crf1 [Paramyrothecium foliicola]